MTQDSARASFTIDDIQRVKQQADADRALTRISFEFIKPERGGAVLESIVSELVGLGIGVREAAPRKASLEDVFAQLTGVEEG